MRAVAIAFLLLPSLALADSKPEQIEQVEALTAQNIELEAALLSAKQAELKARAELFNRRMREKYKFGDSDGYDLKTLAIRRAPKAPKP